jgi:hypothetical protein
MAWVICRTKFGPFDDRKKMFFDNEQLAWVELHEATRFDSRKFVLPRGYGAVFLSEKDAQKVVEGKMRLEVTRG